MNRVVGYIRVSTDEQAEKGFSLRHQRHLIETWGKQAEWEVIKIYEEDYSAKNFDRPEMKKLIEFVKANRKNVDTIICTKWDRFSRNQEEALRVIRMFRGWGIKVNTIEQPLDLDITDNKLLLSFYLAMPEVENDKNSIRTQDGMRQANIEGCWTGSAPFGYKNVRTADGKSTLEPNEKAELVKKAFSEYAKGVDSMEAVRKRLYKSGMKLTKNGFAALLKNVAYTGKIKVKARGKQDEIVLGLHPAIISEDVFNVVQHLITGKKKVHIETKVNPLYPLRNFLICPLCGGNLTGSAPTSQNGERHPYYHCQNKKCVQSHIDTELAHEKFLEFLKSFEISEEAAELYLVILEDVIKQNEGDHQKDIEQIEIDIKKLQARTLKLTDMLMDREIDQSTYNGSKKEYESRMNDLIATLTETKVQDKSLKKGLRYGLPLLTHLSEVYSKENVFIQRKIIGSIFPNKLIIDNYTYRTTKPNSFLELISNNINDLERHKKRANRFFNDPPSKAPPLGLEPRTP